MPQVSFSSGNSSSLEAAELKEGRFSFIPYSSSGGELYLDLNKKRWLVGPNLNEMKKQLASLNEAFGDASSSSSLWDIANFQKRLKKLEDLILVHSIWVELNSAYKFYTDMNYTVYADITPDDCTDDIVWEVGDESILEISYWINNVTTGRHGVVLKPISAGTTTLTVTAGEHSSAANITVEDITFIKHVLIDDYQCEGETFSWTIPINFSNGDYVEAEYNVSKMLSNVATKENVIGFGKNLARSSGTGTGARVHVNVSQNMATRLTHVRFYIIRDNSTSAGTEIKLSDNGIFRVKLDINGLWINDTLIEIANNTVYANAIADILAYDEIEVGSMEGSIRSHVYYNYINYYTSSAE